MINLNNIQKSNDHRRANLPGRILVAHQAEFMPWLGFISKAAMGDIYLILDETQFKKKYFENRNKIRYSNSDGWIWLNIPVKNKNALPNMMDVEIADNNWKNKHLKAIQLSYSKAPFFNEYFPIIENLYLDFYGNKLVEFNIKIINLAFKLFEIKAPIFRVSELIKNGYKISGSGTELVISLCKAVNADNLVAGISGKDYLDINKFNKNNVGVVFQDFKHPNYNQLHGEFIPYMSFLDVLFNYGDEAVHLLPKSNYLT